MNPAARFVLKVLRLGSDTSSAVASNLGASAIDRGNASVATVCIAIAATFTAFKTSADYYLDAQEKQKAEDALNTLIRQHGDLRKALQAVASGQAQTEILSELRAQEFLGLIDRDPDDPAELATQQNEILFKIVQWLEHWQASHQQEAELLSVQITKRFDDQAAVLGQNCGCRRRRESKQFNRAFVRATASTGCYRSQSGYGVCQKRP